MFFKCIAILLAIPYLFGVRLKAYTKTKAQRSQHQALAQTQSHLQLLYPAWEWDANRTSSLLQYVSADIIAAAAAATATESTHLSAHFQQSGDASINHAAIFLDNGLRPATLPVALERKKKASMLQIKDVHGGPIKNGKDDEVDVAVPTDTKTDLEARLAKLEELEGQQANRTIKTWPDGVVFLKFDDEVSEKTRTILLRAIFEFERTTCIRFVDITNDGCPEDLPADQAKACQHPVIVVKGDVCSGNIGYLGNQATKKGPGQLLTLADGCEFYGVILHEIGHIVGIDHEQNRWDRDEHVSIHVENIMDDRYLIAFARIPWSGMVPQHQDVPYDLNSVMHYEPCAFGNEQPGFMNNYQCAHQTLTVKHPEKVRSHEVVGQRIRLSVMDVVKFNKMYECSTATPWGAGVTEDNAFPSMVTWGSDSSLGWPGERISFIRQRVQRGVPFYQDTQGTGRWLVLNKKKGWRLCSSPSCGQLLFRPNTDGHLDIEANPVFLSLGPWSGPLGMKDQVIVRGGPTALWVTFKEGFEGFDPDEWRGYYWQYSTPESLRPIYFHMECQAGQCKKMGHSLQWLPTVGTQLSDAGGSVWSFVRETAVVASIESNAWSPLDVHDDVTNQHIGKQWTKPGDPSVPVQIKIEQSLLVSTLDMLD